MTPIKSLATMAITSGLLVASFAVSAQSSSVSYAIKLCNNSPYSSSGCKDILEHYVMGPNAAAHVAEDQKILKKTCKPKKSQSSSCGVLAFAHASGAGVEQNSKKAAKYAKKGCPLEKKKKSKQRPDLISCSYQFEKAKASGDIATAKKFVDRAYIIKSDAGKTELINWMLIEQKGRLGYAVQSGNFRKDCDKGLGIACYADAATWEKSYGWKHRRGPQKLLDVPGMYFQRGCDAGHGQSCAEFARGVKAGKVPSMSSSDAGSLIARACNNGYQSACNSPEGRAAANANYRGISPSLLVNQQLVMADMAIDRGYAPQAVRTLERLSAQAHPEARVRLGSLYLSGAKNFPANRSMALKWYGASAHPDGLYFAALMSAQNGDNAGYSKYMNDAYWAGNKEAKTWWLAKQRSQQAASEAAGRARAAQYAEDKASQYQADRLSMERALNGYGQNAKEKRVCAMIYQGGRMTRECMSEDHFDRYFRP